MTASLGASPVAAACEGHIWTQGFPTWTYLEPSEAWGTLGWVKEQTDPFEGWQDIEGPSRYVWKSDGGEHETTLTPVVFTSEVFDASCGLNTPSGTLKINADDSYEAYLNGVLVSHCGDAIDLVFHDQPAPCWADTHTLGVILLPYGNLLVVLAWNYGGQAMIQYDLSW